MHPAALFAGGITGGLIIIVGAARARAAMLANPKRSEGGLLPPKAAELPVGGHFTIDEFNQKNPFVAYPQEWIADRLLPLMSQLEILRTELGGKVIKITSGYRTIAHNKSIGGAVGSQHTQGRAADIQVDGVPAAEVQQKVAELIKASKLPLVKGFGVYDAFTHIDVRPQESLSMWVGSSKSCGSACQTRKKELYSFITKGAA